VNLFQFCAAYEETVPVFRQPYGVSEPRIIGGQLATRGQFPYQASISVDDKAFCAGFLISKNWILTAGHCVSTYKLWTVNLGETDRLANEPSRVRVRSTKGISHEQFVVKPLANDIGLIELPEAVPLSGKSYSFSVRSQLVFEMRVEC